MSRLSILFAVAVAFSIAQPSDAGAIADAAGDFLPSYTGPQAADLDLRRVEVRSANGQLDLQATLGGTVGSTPGAFVAFGINRGAGTAGQFQAADPKIGPFALHDALVLLRPNLTGTVVLVTPGGPPAFVALGAGSVNVSGNTIFGAVPLGLLPSTGFAPDDYTFIAWTRSGPGSNALVADFAPNDSTLRAHVPEPGAAGLLALALAGIALRRRRAAS